MIDDYKRAMALVKKMKAQIPIPVRPSPALLRVARKQKLNFSRDQEIQIKNVFYGGDEGGILCDVTPPGGERYPVIASLTHLEVNPHHPLAEEIRAYQSERTRKLAQMPNAVQPRAMKVHPRRRKRR